MNKEDILKILEGAKDKNGDVPMRLVRQAFEKLSEPCTDTISRQAAIDMVDGWFKKIGLNGDICLDGLRTLPSAQPEQRWIPKEVEMKIPVKLDKGAYMPEKAHETDAGYDIRTPHSFLLRRSDMVMVHTGIHVNIPVGFYGELASKSGLCRDSEITTEAGIIDSGYTGEICVILKSGMKQRYFEAGDKITQLIIHELPYTELEAVDILPHTDRGADGFGSTGK